MGTRYLTAVYLDGEYKVAQFGAQDGYPRIGARKSFDLREPSSNRPHGRRFRRRSGNAAGSQRKSWKRLIRQKTLIGKRLTRSLRTAPAPVFWR